MWIRGGVCEIALKDGAVGLIIYSCPRLALIPFNKLGIEDIFLGNLHVAERLRSQTKLSWRRSQRSPLINDEGLQVGAKMVLWYWYYGWIRPRNPSGLRPPASLHPQLAGLIRSRLHSHAPGGSQQVPGTLQELSARRLQTREYTNRGELEHSYEREGSEV